MLSRFLDTEARLLRTYYSDTGLDSSGNPVAQPVEVTRELRKIKIRINRRPKWRLTNSGYVEAGSIRIYSDFLSIILGDILKVGEDQFRVVKIYTPSGLSVATAQHVELDVEILNQ